MTDLVDRRTGVPVQHCTVRGIVTRGESRGRTLGFPTANLSPDRTTALPGDGVYAGWMRRTDTGEVFPAAISVGTNPTFDGHRAPRIESHAIDRVGLDLYDIEVEVTLVERLRGMVAFPAVTALVDQMHADVDRARRVLARST